MAGDQQAAQLRGGGAIRSNWFFHLRACRRWKSIEWWGEKEAEGRPEKRGQERSGDGGGETVLVRHPTVFVFMMKDVPETQGKIFGLC